MKKIEVVKKNGKKYKKYIQKIYLDKIRFTKIFTISLGLSHYANGLRECLKHSIPWILRDTVLKYPAVFDENPESKTLFVNTMPISMRGARMDYKNNFESIAQLGKPCDLLYLVDVSSRKTVIQRILERVSVIKIIKSIIGIPEFIYYALREKFSFTEILYCLPDWLNLNSFLYVINQIDLKKYKLVVAFCDAEPRQNLLIQIANDVGCVTATLQHGMFCAPLAHATNAEEEGIELKGVVSQFFLAWNGLTKDYAMLTDIPESAIKILGNPKFIGIKQANCESEEKRCFGVILGGLVFDQDNRHLIEIANEAARKLHMKYYLKYHPNVQNMYYDKLTDKEYCIGIIKRDISLLEYVAQVDFSIVGQSSVFVELTYFKHTVFHMHDKNMPDKFELVKEISFENAEQLCELWKRNDSMSDELEEYLSGPKDVSTQYMNFFHMYL